VARLVESTARDLMPRSTPIADSGRAGAGSWRSISTENEQNHRPRWCVTVAERSGRYRGQRAARVSGSTRGCAPGRPARHTRCSPVRPVPPDPAAGRARTHAHTPRSDPEPPTPDGSTTTVPDGKRRAGTGIRSSRNHRYAVCGCTPNDRAHSASFTHSVNIRSITNPHNAPNSSPPLTARVDWVATTYPRGLSGFSTARCSV
jgi:hypothetical protein